MDSSHGAQELSDLIDERLIFYWKENAQSEDIFRRLNLLDDKSEICTPLEPILENINKIKMKLGILTISPESVALAKAEILNENNNTLDKINVYRNQYRHNNVTLEKAVSAAETEMMISVKKLNDICKFSSKEITHLLEKSTIYQKEVNKNEKKHPWLRNDEFELINIQKLIDKYNEEANKRTELEKELAVYKGLKPNIELAKKQLLELKSEYYKKMGSE